MTFAELRAELLARGFDYLATNDRDAQFINWARAELDDMELWPYREASAIGVAPLEIADLGAIEQVIVTSDSNRSLFPAEYRDLVQSVGDLSTDGSPESYYVASPAGVPVVATYPESSETVGVQYWKVTEDLSAAGDEPLAPSRFHDLIVDLAVVRAYRDQDNHAAAEALQASVERRVGRMRESLFTQQVQGPGYIQIVDGSADS